MYKKPCIKGRHILSVIHRDNNASFLINKLNWEMTDENGKSTLPVQNKQLLKQELDFQMPS